VGVGSLRDKDSVFGQRQSIVRNTLTHMKINLHRSLGKKQRKDEARQKKKKKRPGPIAREPRVGGERQTDGYRTCSDLSARSLLLSTSGRIFKYRCVLLLGRKMSDCKSEQRVNIKFLVKLKKSATETFHFTFVVPCIISLLY
jgi:hypothetical protein